MHRDAWSDDPDRTTRRGDTTPTPWNQFIAAPVTAPQPGRAELLNSMRELIDAALVVEPPPTVPVVIDMLRDIRHELEYVREDMLPELIRECEDEERAFILRSLDDELGQAWAAIARARAITRELQ